MLLAVKHEREKHSVVICVCVSIFKFTICVCVCIPSQGQERRHAGCILESLNRMSGMHKNTMKEPETEVCRMLPLCMVTLNVLNRASSSTCGGGRPVINHTSQQSPKEMLLFLVCLMLKVSPKLPCPIRETQRKKRGIRLWISTYEDAVKRSQVFKCASN